MPDPLALMAGYDGYVAIDLGNTGSMLAYLGESVQEKDFEEARFGWWILDSIRRTQSPVPTAIRILSYKKPKDDPTDFRTTRRRLRPNAECEMAT